MKKYIIYALGLFLLSSCAAKRMTKSVVYDKLYEQKPAVVLLLPPINKSTKVEAKELFYSTLSEPFTQQGYYVLPPLMAMDILKQESAYDAELFLDNSMKRVGELFGCDAVLFTIIHKWEKMTIAATINVKVEYILKSTKTDEVLFNRIGNISLSSDTEGGSGWSGLINVAVGMLTTALTNEIVAGRSCNWYTLSDLPAGKYSPKYQTDGDEAAGAKAFTVMLSQ